MVCDRCGKKAVIYVRYSGRHLCADHFLEFYERRVKRELALSGRIGHRMAVAVSGGKDSMAMLHVLTRILTPQVEILAIAIDEGIRGYRDKSLEVVRRATDRWGVPLRIVSFREEVGMTLDEIVSVRMNSGISDTSRDDSDRIEGRRACSYCGVFRRYLLNRIAREIGADKLATGHTLDDLAQTVIMNLLRGDIVRIVRTGPHRWVQPGLVPRVMPLRWIPEKENMLYAILKDIPFHHAVCPYSVEAHRALHARILEIAEADTPGTRHALLRGADKIVELYRDARAVGEVSSCTRCGEPAQGNICMYCTLLDEIRAMASR